MVAVASPAVDTAARVAAGTVAKLQAAGVLTVSGTAIGARHGIAVFWHEDQAYAVDNRCPHMGFPLARGTCKDGVLTCNWHYARFDLQSGGTFDLFADNVRAYPVEIEDGQVWVYPNGADADEERERWFGRLDEGLEQNISLVQAKAVLGLHDLDTPPAEIVGRAARHGLRFGSSRNADGWGDGLTILTAMAHVLDDLEPEDRCLALYHGVRRVGGDASGQRTTFDLEPLSVRQVSIERLQAWFREFIEVRSSDAAERTLRTAIAEGATPQQVATMLCAAGTDHYYRDFSHVLDTIAKAYELLDLVGWEQATEVLPNIVPQIAAASREEERNSWQHPVNLPAIVEPATAQLPAVLDLDATPTGQWETALVDTLLEDDPAASIDALMAAFRDGMALADAAQAVAYASALRLTRFPTSNEFGDWDTVLHHFTYCQSVAQMAKRAPSPELARGVLHGAMVVYLGRFLNIPPARLPSERDLAAEPTDPEALTTKLLALCDRQSQVDEAGAVVYRYLTLGHEPPPLLAALGRSVLREDANFHDFQMLEEGLRLYHDLVAAGRREESWQVLVAIARWQAAHSPTRRATTQTYDIALRLHRGEDIYAPSRY
ncbi:MAG: Rieske (2Fe-2S) protein [Chloroflexota bacterium]|nr:Rieske (2Fe-2S) protein [Chloroflexota bacterium]